MTHSGIAINELDSDIRPQDDLFLHMNGKWISRTELPNDKARYGSFAVLAENAEEAVRDIVISTQAPAPGSFAETEAEKVAGLYASFMDTERIDALGAKPIAADLKRVFSTENISNFVKTTASLEREGVSGFVGMYIDNDPGNPERYIIMMMQAGIGLPDESYYREEQFAQVREAYLKHIERMFELTGVADAKDRARRVFDLEAQIASSHWDKVASRDIQKLYNLHSFTELQELTPTFDWPSYLEAMGAPAAAFEEVVVGQTDAISNMLNLLTADRLADWQAWLAWRVVSGSAALLSTEIAKANFDFYGTTLTGTPEQRDRWKRAVSFVEGAMGEAVGKLYVDKHFDEQAKTEMDVLVEYLIEAYRDSIQNLSWMGQETKERALTKLDKFTPKIGYPVKWRDYSALDVDSGDLLGNSRRVALYEFEREFAKIGKPIDRDEWFMVPQTVNAYYNPGFNEIVFPAAILQPPFFDKNADPAANFGAIGAVIGHEIGHGFDDQGSRYDGDGKLTDWWTEEDRTAFEKLTVALIDQYNELSPAGANGQKVNGELTIGENIGDLSGLEIAWKAYNSYLADNASEEDTGVVDGLSRGERFFLAWAQAWQQKSRPEETVRLLTIDPHSPNEFRCNQIVRNLDPFHETFQTKPGDGLWMEPSERVSIW
ncbi:MAG TPA: M13-type metalloendopeptidase [Microbacteriaceae bacterium]|nr:M13-type metalloendopeptidase [Microbacteriaceae bacterium]